MMKFIRGLTRFASATISSEKAFIWACRKSFQLRLPFASMHISHRQEVKKKSSRMISSKTSASSRTTRRYSFLWAGSL